MVSLDNLTLGHVYEINGTKGVVVLIPGSKNYGFLVRELEEPVCYYIEGIKKQFVEAPFYDGKIGDEILDKRGL